MWAFSMSVAREQIAKGCRFAIEHPAGSDAWTCREVEELLKEPGVKLVTFHMCSFGMRVDTGLNKKPTSLLTNDPSLI